MGNDRTLDDILSEITAAKAVANMNMETVPPPVRPAWLAKVAQSREKLAALEAEYRVAVAKKLTPVFLSGEPSKVKEFVTLAEDMAISVSASALYDDMANEVEPVFGKSRQWSNDQTRMVRLRIQRELSRVGIDGVDAPDLGNPILPDKEAVKAHIVSCLNKVIGASLNVLSVRQTALDEALEFGVNGPAPYLVTDVVESESQSLKKDLGNKGAHLEIQIKEDDVVDTEYVNKSFADLAAKKKKTKK